MPKRATESETSGAKRGTLGVMPRRVPVPTLDPPSFDAFRTQAHAILDSMLDHIERAPSGPVWRPMPPEVRGAFREPVPLEGTSMINVQQDLERLVLPYSNGNLHPRFLGWVHG